MEDGKLWAENGVCGAAIAEALVCPVTGSIEAVIRGSTNTSCTWKQCFQTSALDLFYVYICVPEEGEET